MSSIIKLRKKNRPQAWISNRKTFISLPINGMVNYVGVDKESNLRKREFEQIVTRTHITVLRRTLI